MGRRSPEPFRATPGEIVRGWALFARLVDGDRFRRLPVVFATRRGARENRDHDEVVRPVVVVVLDRSRR